MEAVLQDVCNSREKNNGIISLVIDRANSLENRNSKQQWI